MARAQFEARYRFVAHSHCGNPPNQSITLSQPSVKLKTCRGGWGGGEEERERESENEHNTHEAAEWGGRLEGVRVCGGGGGGWGGGGGGGVDSYNSDEWPNMHPPHGTCHSSKSFQCQSGTTFVTQGVRHRMCSAATQRAVWALP